MCVYIYTQRYQTAVSCCLRQCPHLQRALLHLLSKFHTHTHTHTHTQHTHTHTYVCVFIKIKAKDNPTKEHYSFFNLGARWGVYQSHAPAALTRGKTRYRLYRRLGGPQGQSGRVRKISPPPGFYLRVSSP